ncbi:MAG: bifunctional riboflavin kinase/FAD synthetase [Gammaproteobacteria bacterium]|jgi:riboflavin kinase/FMN adenylyltransferase
MELIRDLHNLKAVHRPCVATIGNFDGVHLGHQAVIRQLQRHAAELGLPAVVITFEPQPMEFFAPEAAPARLTPFREKLELLDQYAVDRVFCLRFRRSLAMLAAEDFVEDLLVDRLGIRRVIVGDDFRFGRGRQGDVSLLTRLGRRHGFQVIPTETYYCEGERVSSSRIRNHLAAGEFEAAARLLGRPYYISGRVVHGDKRGTGLGFPTANLLLNRKKSPVTGIFVVRVHGLGEEIHAGVASIGTRPVFNGLTELLEVYLFDFDRMIYGQRIRVEFLHFLRPERNFGSTEALLAQMRRDVHDARTYFDDKKKDNEVSTG